MNLPEPLPAEWLRYIPDAVVVCQGDKLVYLNPAAEQMLQGSLSAFSDNTVFDLFADIQPAGNRPREMLAGFFNGAQPAPDSLILQGRLRRKSGVTFDATITLAVLGTTAEQQTVVYFRDISKEKTLRKRFQKNERVLQFLYDHADFVYWELDAETLKTLYVSDSIVRMQGHTAEEVLSMDFEETLSDPLIARQIRETIRDKLAEFETNGIDFTDARVYSANIPRVCKDGRAVWTEVTSRYIRNPDSGRIEIHGVSRYVTDAVVAQKALQDTREYLHTIVDAMPSALIGVGDGDMIALWNEGVEMISGISGGIALGNPVSDIWPEAVVVRDMLRQTVLLQKKQVQYSVFLPGAARERRFNLLCFPVQTNGTDGAVLRIDDVTEQAAMQELLIQSEKMLSLGGLAAGMAHEINNPLGGIVQLSQVLKSRLKQSGHSNDAAAAKHGFTMEQLQGYIRERKIEEMVDGIQRAGNRAGDIIRNMLDYARQTSDSYTWTDMRDVVAQTLALAQNELDLNRKVDFGRISVMTDYEKDLPAVRCNVGRIQQVLFNLFKNSAQAFSEVPFSPGRWQLRIRLAADDCMFTIEIEDNGPGMSEEVRASIFEPFFSTKKARGGSGLGLPICRFIVKEFHKGEIDVRSKLGEGTSFRIQLPIDPNLADPGASIRKSI
jgi:PAS domain S-box-containing protein